MLRERKNTDLRIYARSGPSVYNLSESDSESDGERSEVESNTHIDFEVILIDAD